MIPPRTGYYQYEIRQNVKRAQYYSWHDRIEGQYVPLVSECYLSKQLLGISKFLGMLFEASRRHTARGYPGDLHSLSGFKSVLSIHRLHPPLRSFHDPSLCPAGCSAGCITQGAWLVDVCWVDPYLASADQGVGERYRVLTLTTCSLQGPIPLQP